MIITNDGYIISYSKDYILADYIGWTDISMGPDTVYEGSPPEEELKYLGWRRRKKAESGNLVLPAFCASLNDMHLIERKLFKDGLHEMYLKNLRWLGERGVRLDLFSTNQKKVGDIDVSDWAIMHADSFARCAAAVLLFGEGVEKEPHFPPWLTKNKRKEIKDKFFKEIIE